MNAYIPAIIGGLAIGLTCWLMMLFFGRITGISSMVGHLCVKLPKQWLPSSLFLLGCALGGAIAFQLTHIKPLPIAANPLYIVTAGLLVGFGSGLGSGCTSGHGICGISRLSLRSIIATITFMGTAMGVVYLLRHIL